jgi:hypothetical protein
MTGRLHLYPLVPHRSPALLTAFCVASLRAWPTRTTAASAIALARVHCTLSLSCADHDQRLSPLSTNPTTNRPRTLIALRTVIALQSSKLTTYPSHFSSVSAAQLRLRQGHYRAGYKHTKPPPAVPVTVISRTCSMYTRSSAYNASPDNARTLTNDKLGAKGFSFGAPALVWLSHKHAYTRTSHLDPDISRFHD